jgi:hypothetical protein
VGHLGRQKIICLLYCINLICSFYKYLGGGLNNWGGNPWQSRDDGRAIGGGKGDMQLAVLTQSRQLSILSSFFFIRDGLHFCSVRTFPRQGVLHISRPAEAFFNWSGKVFGSLEPRLTFGGRGKRAWYTLSAHQRAKFTDNFLV